MKRKLYKLKFIPFTLSLTLTGYLYTTCINGFIISYIYIGVLNIRTFSEYDKYIDFAAHYWECTLYIYIIYLLHRV